MAKETGPKDIRKQAVVVIHGIGEQQPMGTLRSLARALWTLNDGIGGPRSDKQPPWLAPDTKTGSTELMRMTTSVSDDGYRVDFFECYWADIMAGNTREQVAGWLSTLLLRWPHNVPRNVFGVWIVLWLCVAIFLGGSTAGLLKLMSGEGDGAPDAGGGERWLDGVATKLFWPLDRVSDIFAGVGNWFAAHTPGATIWALLLGIVLCAILVLLHITILRKLRDALRRDEPGAGFGKAGSILLAVLTPPVAVFALCVLAVLAFGAVVTSEGAQTPFLTAAVSLVVGTVVNMIVVPYVGDVARYVQNKPDTVGKRAQVRERGLQLLRALHGLPPEGGEFDPTAVEQPYGRVTLVCHSLGTMIGYDLLNLFWAEAGLIKKNQPSDAAMRLMRRLDAWLAKAETSESFDVAGYQKAQWILARRLARDGHVWRITDFITLGSPLRHAEFLIARNSKQFREFVSERFLTLCPPADPSNPEGRIFYPLNNRDGVETGRAIHHAALFAAVRWTNIYDNGPLALFGDFISGPLSGLFGSGINDVRIVLRRCGGLRGHTRLVTHTAYWDDAARGTLMADESAWPERFHVSGDDQHLQVLQQAVDLPSFTQLMGKLDTLAVQETGRGTSEGGADSASIGKV